ncbi:MAG: ABC-F family ATP-binding cassette domain-containing protein [Lachnospiraceae bacterium]|nr:ABC-F family ATP-binding cassette domain-containing protein [Lachnospiraceae bacterium]
MVLSCQNITKSFADSDILYGVSFQVDAHEKVAVVGVNGAGKTTLLKIICGEIEPDAGEAYFARGIRYGYLAQNQDLRTGKTLYETLKEAKREIIALEDAIHDAEERMKTLEGDALITLTEQYADMTRRFKEEGGYAWRSGIVGVAKGLGFTEADFEKKTGMLSGGERTRVALGKLLLEQPELLILDEPTNHLDIKSVQWLETYLRNYRGAVLIVSHDRYFLDRIVTKVVEIEHTKSRVYKGNYSVYSNRKAEARAIAWHAYVNQQKEIRRQEEVIRKLKSYNREKSVKRAESREKMLEKTERLEKPVDVQDEMRIRLTPNVESGNDVLQVEGLAKSYDGRTLFRDVSFTVHRGERIAIVGDNGTGKTTLLKIINKIVQPDTGKIRLGVKVHIGYYDQAQQLLHENKSLFDEISDAFPDLDNTTIRSTLAAFLFTGDEVFYKHVSDLSGGEKGKLALAKLMLSEANFLILDEPTNHLDITSREVLESALRGYEGTVLFVSHDRYFINRTATRVMDLTNEMLINYIGNYDYYIEHKPNRMHFILHTPYEKSRGAKANDAAADTAGENVLSGMQLSREAPPVKKEPSDGLKDWKAQKELAAMQRKQASALQKCEEMIESLEARNEEINKQFSLAEIASNAVKLKWLSDEQEQIRTQLDDLYRQWDALS